jgi:hypothetical protein
MNGRGLITIVGRTMSADRIHPLLCIIIKQRVAHGEEEGDRGKSRFKKAKPENHIWQSKMDTLHLYVDRCVSKMMFLLHM